MKTHRPDICILGGTGFVGRHLVTHLAGLGFPLKVLTRKRERHRELLVLPKVSLIEADILDEKVLNSHFTGCGAVINLVGILNEKRRDQFRTVHVELPRRIVHACLQQNVPRLLHMSALGADAGLGTSRYLRSKGEGEALVHAAATAHFHVTSFRPSVIFGPDDHFFNQFACLLKYSPGIMPLPCPDAKFAPVCVDDVVQAFALALQNKACHGQAYELCGPHAYTLRELVDYVARVLGLQRQVIGLPDWLSRLQARLGALLPGKPYTMDNYLSMQTASICKGSFPAVFKHAPLSVEGVLPFYLGRQDQRAHYDRYRREAGRTE